MPRKFCSWSGFAARLRETIDSACGFSPQAQSASPVRRSRPEGDRLQRAQRILFLTCHLPYPPFSGGRLREFELIKRIGATHEVFICAVSKTYEEDVACAHELAPYCSDVTLFRAGEGERAAPAAPIQVLRHRSAEMTAHVAAAIETLRPDVIHVEGFYLMQHVPTSLPMPLLLVEQNVEYLLWKQRGETAIGRDERERHLREYLLTLEAEIAAWRRATICAAVTEEDRAAMVAAEPSIAVRVVPDGTDHLVPQAPGAAPEPDLATVTFVANFAYQPNVDAAMYLLSRLWPRIHARVPSARLLLVGNGPPPGVVDVARSTPGVTVAGRVPSVEGYIDRATVILCPLRVGGGIKVKVLEALSRGKAIVTTTVGAQGLGPEARRAMAVEDKAEPLVDATVRLLKRPRKRKALEGRALAFARTLPSWDEAAAELLHCYSELSSAPSSDPQIALSAKQGSERYQGAVVDPVQVT